MSARPLREGIRSGVNMFRAVAPTVLKAVCRGQVFRPCCRLLPADPNVEMQVDVPVPVADGFALTAPIPFPGRAMVAAEGSVEVADPSWYLVTTRSP